MTASYYEELAERLRAAGVPDDEAARTVDDLAAYAAESGADPRDEFGTPEEFAARLAPARAGGGSPGPDELPGEADETWVWTADAFQDRLMLGRFGDEGWEVERIDAAGRFVSRRDVRNPQRWEYRRETVLPGRRRALADRLAPDGWEPCGTWMCFEYFKRPKAASLGPEAELDAPPETPAKRYFWSGRFYVFIVVYGAFLAVVGALWIASAPDFSRSGFLTGFVVGTPAGARGDARPRHRYRPGPSPAWPGPAGCRSPGVRSDSSSASAESPRRSDCAATAASSMVRMRRPLPNEGPRGTSRSSVRSRSGTPGASRSPSAAASRVKISTSSPSE